MSSFSASTRLPWRQLLLGSLAASVDRWLPWSCCFLLPRWPRLCCLVAQPAIQALLACAASRGSLSGPYARHQWSRGGSLPRRRSRTASRSTSWTTGTSCVESQRDARFGTSIRPGPSKRSCHSTRGTTQTRRTSCFGGSGSRTGRPREAVCPRPSLHPPRTRGRPRVGAWNSTACFSARMGTGRGTMEAPCSSCLGWSSPGMSLDVRRPCCRRRRLGPCLCTSGTTSKWTVDGVPTLSLRRPCLGPH
mmetsp:Transcript_13202/g.38351  ORF Transcript_13202/g.38351 Transcript_13202/m.38351 type:complete len:248 (-) Transcript_13202:163-906(-)